MAELDEYTAQVEREERQKDFLLGEIKKGASEEITSNPAFERAFDRFYSYMKQEVGSSYMTPDISEDGKTVSITKEGVNRDPVGLGRMLNNRAIGRLIYSIDEAGNLRVEFDSGELYDAVEYVNAMPDPTVRERFERDYHISEASKHKQNSMLDTNYIASVYNKHGVELSHGNYYDMGMLITDSVRNTALSTQVLSELHKPRLGYLSKYPMFSTDRPKVRFSYRSENSLGVILTKTVGGKNQLPIFEIYGANTEHPERLAPSISIPAATYDIKEGAYVINQDFYPGIKDLKELKEYLDDSFTMGIEGSKTKEYDSEQYEGILATMSQEEEKEQTK